MPSRSCVMTADTESGTFVCFRQTCVTELAAAGINLLSGPLDWKTGTPRFMKVRPFGPPLLPNLHCKPKTYSLPSLDPT
jgi:hypothetical protein